MLEAYIIDRVKVGSDWGDNLFDGALFKGVLEISGRKKSSEGFRTAQATKLQVTLHRGFRVFLVFHPVLERTHLRERVIDVVEGNAEDVALTEPEASTV